MLQVAAHYSMQLKDPENLQLWGKIFLTSLIWPLTRLPDYISYAIIT
jgi:hypothetical protein